MPHLEVNLPSVRVEISQSDLISALDFSDPEVIDEVLYELIESWDYTKELHSDFSKRISSLIKDGVRNRRNHMLYYGGSLSDNVIFCEKEIKAGRTVNVGTLKFLSN